MTKHSDALRVATVAWEPFRKVSLVEVGTHVELAFVLKRLGCGETTAMEGLWRHIPADSLLLEDRGFFSYEQWKRALSENVAVLARVKSGLILKPIRRLRDGSYLAKIYPSSYDRAKDRYGIVVRVIRYKLNDPQRVGHDEEHVLMNTLLDAERYPASELIVSVHFSRKDGRVAGERAEDRSRIGLESPGHHGGTLEWAAVAV